MRSLPILLLFVSLVAFSQEKKIPLSYQLERLDGTEVNTSDMAIDKEFVILDFWNEGCKPCIAQLNSFTKQYDSLLARGIKVIAVSTFPRSAAAEKIVAKYQWPFEVYFDASKKRLFKKYSPVNVTVPFTVILNDDWQVILKKRGAPLQYVGSASMPDGERITLTMKAFEEGDYEKLEVRIEDYYSEIDKYKSRLKR